MNILIKQTSLSNNAPMILDATCSFRKNYPKFATIRIDIRPETNPDIVMDAKDLKFTDNYFDEIYCDPPHLKRKGEHKTESFKRRLTGRTSPGFWKRYGSWENKEQWLEFVEKTNIEFSRCLKPKGILNYKITDSPIIKYEEFISKMTNFKILECKNVQSKSNLAKGNIVRYIKFINKKET